jgi:hypothetical protein
VFNKKTLFYPNLLKSLKIDPSERTTDDVARFVKQTKACRHKKDRSEKDRSEIRSLGLVQEYLHRCQQLLRRGFQATEHTRTAYYD